LAVLALCGPQNARAADPAEIALVQRVFAALQHRPFAEDVEYCGYIGFDAGGRLVATNATRGEQSACLAGDPFEALDLVVASYHTHGAFSPDAFAELPSPEDVLGDADEGIDGYVATPGGRLWYVDGEDLIVSMICDLGCLPTDPNFEPGFSGPIEQSYTLDALEHHMETW